MTKIQCSVDGKQRASRRGLVKGDRQRGMLEEIRFVESKVRQRGKILEKITVWVSKTKAENPVEGVAELRQRNTYPVSFTLWLQLISNRLSFERISIDRLRQEVRERRLFRCSSAFVRPRGWVYGLRETCSLSSRQLHSAFLRFLVSTRLYQASPFLTLFLVSIRAESFYFKMFELELKFIQSAFCCLNVLAILDFVLFFFSFFSNLLKGVHLCAGGTSSAFSGFFRKNHLKCFNELYVILEVYFSILVTNFFKSLIWSLIFTPDVVIGLLKKWCWNCGQVAARTSCLKHGWKKSRYLLLNGRGTRVEFCQNVF